MAQVNPQIDPLSTNVVLTHLGLAIDEIKLLRSIDQLKEQLRLSDSMRIDIDRRHFLVAELRYLNKRLILLREQASCNGCRRGLARRSNSAV